MNSGDCTLTDNFKTEVITKGKGEVIGCNNQNPNEVAIVTELTKFAVLKYEKYTETIEKFRLSEENDEVEFFLKLPYFSSWSKRSIVRVIKALEKVNFQMKQTVI